MCPFPVLLYRWREGKLNGYNFSSENTEGTKCFFEVRLPYEQQEENDTVNEQNCYHI